MLKYFTCVEGGMQIIWAHFLPAEKKQFYCRPTANLPQLVLSLAQLPCMMDHTFPSSSDLHKFAWLPGGGVINAITDLRMLN